MNSERIQLSLDMMSEKGKLLFKSVPLLLHFNHSSLPCYVGDGVPSGFVCFSPNDEQIQILDILSSFTFKNIPSSGLVNHGQLESLFCMGSTSSVGQGPFSDIDYWLCVSKSMTEEKISLLEKKCLAIKLMALKQYNMEINFFIVKDSKFKEPMYEKVDSENCGSAQHLFLLDEFYRSVIYLCGKKLLWMVVPSLHESDYEDYTEKLFANKILNRNEWIDFGCVSNIPTGEYYGSALWLLYKGTDAPFKAVIKILLMEMYSSEYPNTELISIKIKKYFHENDEFGLNCDSYYVIYKSIYSYLKSRNDQSRIDLLNFCFYRKISDGISRIDNYHVAKKRKNFIQNLLKNWKWTHEYIEKINQRKNILRLRNMYYSIFNALMQSYKELLSFGVKNNISDTINFQDMSVLSRKLYSKFDKFSGKIELYTLEKTDKPYEGTVSFINVLNSNVCKNGCYVYKQGFDATLLLGAKPIAYFENLSIAIVSLFFNGVIEPKTNLFLYNYKGTDNEKINVFLNSLQKKFCSYKIPFTNDTLLKPALIKKSIVYINLLNDPTNYENYVHIGRETPNVNIFSLKPFNKSMIGSITIVLTNTWNEVICKSYEGVDCFVNFLRDLGTFFSAGCRFTEEIECEVLSCHMQVLIQQQFLNIVNRCLNSLKSRTNDSFLLVIENSENFININRRSITVGTKENKEYLGNSLKIPTIIDENIMYGCIQYFFIKENFNEYFIYEVDDKLDIKIVHYNGFISSLIQNINLHYSKVIDIEIAKNIKYKQYFNLPQFFYVDLKKNTISPLII